MPGRRNRATRLSGVPDNPGTARDGDPGQDERQAGHRQTDPLLRRARSRSRPSHDAHRGHGSRTWRVTRTHQNLIGY